MCYSQAKAYGNTSRPTSHLIPKRKEKGALGKDPSLKRTAKNKRTKIKEQKRTKKNKKERKAPLHTTTHQHPLLHLSYPCIFENSKTASTKRSSDKNFLTGVFPGLDIPLPIPKQNPFRPLYTPPLLPSLAQDASPAPFHNFLPCSAFFEKVFLALPTSSTPPTTV